MAPAARPSPFTAGGALARLLLLAASGCGVAPAYVRPPATTPPAWRELTPADFASTDGWKRAQPQDVGLPGRWWELFGDERLNGLEEQVDVSNQNVALAAATLHAARAVAAQARSEEFPTVTTTPTLARASAGAARPGQLPVHELPLEASYEADVWGRVRSSVAAGAAEAHASAADLQSTRLSVQAELAADYFLLRGQDAQHELLARTVAAYRQALDLTRIRHEGGLASDEDVAQAEAQLASTQAQETDLGVERARLEHALAALVGRPASTFSLSPDPLRARPPAVPLGVPSQLLERRPDVAAAERRVAAANARIGVSRAAFFPTVTLFGEGGFASSTLATLVSWPSRFWALGATLAETIFDGGRRRATVDQAAAEYDGTVASYRLTVLSALQQVEDALAALRILSRERQQQEDAVRSATAALARAEDRYRFGLDSYLNVVTAQSALLAGQRAAVNVGLQQMTASVALVEALGGGWEASAIPASGAEPR